MRKIFKTYAEAEAYAEEIPGNVSINPADDGWWSVGPRVDRKILDRADLRLRLDDEPWQPHAVHAAIKGAWNGILELEVTLTAEGQDTLTPAQCDALVPVLRSLEGALAALRAEAEARAEADPPARVETLARAAARDFEDDFPGQDAELGWIAEAASIDGIDDVAAYEQAFLTALGAMRNDREV